MKRSWLGLAALVAIALFIGTASLSQAHGDQKDLGDLLNDPIANRQAVFEAIYEEAGYSEQDATTLATRALATLQGQQLPDFVALDPVDADVVLDPATYPLALFQRFLLDHGVDEDESSEITGRLWLVLQPNFEGPEAAAHLEVGCTYFLMKIRFCTDDPSGLTGKRWAELKIDANCWQLQVQPLIQSFLPACPSEESHYLKLGYHCGVIDAQPGAVFDIVGPLDGPCDGVTNCDCLDLPAQGMLNWMCCPLKGGCPGCPDDWDWSGHN